MRKRRNGTSMPEINESLPKKPLADACAHQSVSFCFRNMHIVFNCPRRSQDGFVLLMPEVRSQKRAVFSQRRLEINHIAQCSVFLSPSAQSLLRFHDCGDIIVRKVCGKRICSRKELKPCHVIRPRMAIDSPRPRKVSIEIRLYLVEVIHSHSQTLSSTSYSVISHERRPSLV